MFLLTNFELNNKNVYTLKYAINQETGEVIDIFNFNKFNSVKIYVDNLNLIYPLLIKECFKNNYKCV